MSRMDKYEEIDEKIYSRTRKNEDLYKDVYLNNTLIDFDKIMQEDVLETEEEKQEQFFECSEINYVEKDYDLSNFLTEKRKQRIQDNLPRSLSEDLKKSDDEISELISKIEQKENDDELFKELLPDSEETTILESRSDNLNSYISDDAINNFVMHKNIDETSSFMDIEETNSQDKQINKSKNKKRVAIMVFSITLILLIILIVYLLINKFI